MRFTAVHAGLALALLGGCAGPVHTAQLSSDHPASASAAEAPLPAPSQTLTVNPSATPAAETHGVVPPQVRQPGEHAASAGSHDHAAMPGMTMGSAAAPATSPAAGTLYACPMHPEVTSTNPNDRCPKCGMKVNKPVKATTAPAAKPAPQPAQHQHDHGGGDK